MHKIISSVALAGMVALSLVACSTPSAPDCDVTPSGPASSKIAVSGAADAEPTVTIPSPLDTTETQRTVVTEGDGEVVEPGMYVTTNFVLYNAATGDRIDGSKDFSSSGEFPFVVDGSRILSGIVKIVQCSTVGSRVVGIVPPADAFGKDGPNFGVGATDSLVFVFDIKKVEASEPSAAPVELPTPAEWTQNVPTVDLGGDVPVVTLPATDPPAELELLVIKAGDGDLVTDTSTVTVDYQGTSWDTGEIFDQSYTRGEPSTFPATGVIKGFAAAMVGQKAGATVLVTIPPQYAYGTDPNAHDLGGQTLVFLIQIRKVS
ncbi:hypothetical protein GCM10022239_23670 [Leifsonia bigeumensis]|uniref:Peptidyl-prolyl cis-trans isomerase n=1 Tax=Leifsonella bigeumensis TaxID=433643 RepID=A0ABP7FVB6_9MICO